MIELASVPLFVVIVADESGRPCYPLNDWYSSGIRTLRGDVLQFGSEAAAREHAQASMLCKSGFVVVEWPYAFRKERRIESTFGMFGDGSRRCPARKEGFRCRYDKGHSGAHAVHFISDPALTWTSSPSKGVRSASAAKPPKSKRRRA